MKFSCFIIAGLLCAIFITQVYANCLCGAVGEDYCTCKQFNPLPSKLLIGSPPNFPPVGDRCWCEKQVVEPAIPPKPCCPKKLPIMNLPMLFTKSATVCNKCGFKDVEKSLKLGSTCSCNCKCKDLELPMPTYVHHKPIHHGLPADPVSVSLAYKMGNFFAVPEAKLQYGFRTTPINAIEKIQKPSIPEEKLFALSKQVIELKKKKIEKKDEEITEEESEEDYGYNPSYLTYKELGYCPEKFVSAKFVDIPSQCSEKPSCLEPQLEVGNCGFKLGRIVPFAEEEAEDAKLNKYKNCLEDV